jgi:chemotaxis protein methyltransferase CheR
MSDKLDIKTEKTGKTHRVAVLGSFIKKADAENFISRVESIATEDIEVTFFDAAVLPEPVIDRLMQLTGSARKLKIQVVHQSLSSYLYRVGLDHILLTGKKLESRHKAKCRALAIGGSAGSLEPIIKILERLPVSNISVFIVQHILEKSPNYLPSILQTKTKYTVREGVHNEDVLPGHVYIAPPGRQMRIVKGRVDLRDEPPIYFARPSIDVLFESLGYEYQASLIAVLLPGYNNDGSHSLALLHQKKSTVLVIDPNECLEKELPENAIKTGDYDYIFPLPEMISYINRHTEHREIELSEGIIGDFLEKIFAKYGYDYREYHYESISRLIRKEMMEQDIFTFSEFSDLILNNFEYFENLFLEFSVNVTEFFRNPKVFEKVRHNILSYLASFPHIKIWCAGCSTGEEPYSLAIMLQESGLLKKSQIYATDINPFIVEQARSGFFSKKNFKKDNGNYLASGGTGQFADYFEDNGSCLKIRKEIKEKIVFFQHSLVSEGILNEFNLILCRNVLIYFDASLQEKTSRLFYNSLIPNGFLVLGESENFQMNTLFTIYDKNLKIYKKTF